MDIKAFVSVPKSPFLRWVNIPSCSADTDADTDDVTFSTSGTSMDRFVAVSSDGDPQSADHPQETDQDDPSEADDADNSDEAR